MPQINFKSNPFEMKISYFSDISIGMEGYDEAELPNEPKTKGNTEGSNNETIQKNATTVKSTQNPYYGNDIANEESGSRPAKPIVILDNPYYE